MKNQLYKMLAVAMLSASFSLAAGAQTVKTTIPFNFPTLGIAADSVRNLIYVVAPTNGTAPTDNLAIINSSTDTLLSTVAVPSGAAFVAVNEATNRIFVAGCNYTVTPTACTVTAINGSDDQVLDTITVTTTPGLGLTGIVVNPVDNLVYIANASDNEINIINGKSLTTNTAINLNGNSPAAIAINPILNRLYVPYGNSQIAVVDACKKTILTTTTYGSTLVGVAANLVSGNVYVSDSNDAQTGVLDKNGNVLATVLLDSSPLGVDVDPITNLVFVAENTYDTVAVINGSTNAETVALNGVPASYVSVNLQLQKVYVSGRTGVTVLTEK